MVPFAGFVLSCATIKLNLEGIEDSITCILEMCERESPLKMKTRFIVALRIKRILRQHNDCTRSVVELNKFWQHYIWIIYVNCIAIAANGTYTLVFSTSIPLYGKLVMSILVPTCMGLLTLTCAIGSSITSKVCDSKHEN